MSNLWKASETKNLGTSRVSRVYQSEQLVTELQKSCGSLNASKRPPRQVVVARNPCCCKMAPALPALFFHYSRAKSQHFVLVCFIMNNMKTKTVTGRILKEIIAERDQLKRQLNNLTQLVSRFCSVLLDPNFTTSDDAQKSLLVTKNLVQERFDVIARVLSEDQINDILTARPRTSGGVVAKIVQKFLTQFNSEEFGLKLVSLLDLPWTKYDLLRQLFSATLAKNGWNTRIFMFLATKKNVQSQWRTICNNCLKLRKISHFVVEEESQNLRKIISHECNILNIIDYIFKTPMLRNSLKDSDNLEMIFRMDAFPVGGEQGLLAAITFKNFGVLSHIPMFQFMTNLANVSDKKAAHVRLALGQNLEMLNEIARTKKIALPNSCVTINCILRVGGDDPVLRLLFGLKASNCNRLSIYCKCERGKQ